MNDRKRTRWASGSGLGAVLALLAVASSFASQPARASLGPTQPGPPGLASPPPFEVDKGPGFKSIKEKDVEAHIQFLAQPGMEGRDTPSEGQARAAAYLVELYRKHGLETSVDSSEVMGDFGEDGPDHAATEGTFYRPYMREANAPDPKICSLTKGGKDEQSFEYGKDFVPVHRASGQASGDLIFGGFGIDSSKEKYNDFKSLKVKGKVVLFFGGEPRHRKKFDGAEVTDSASLWSKLNWLNKNDAAGALVVRRQPEGAEEDENNGLDYRYTYASWNDARGRSGTRQPSNSLPTLEISMECASAILGTDAAKLAASMDKSAKPKKFKTSGITVSMTSQTSRRSIRHDNVLGILRGTDPALSDEYLLLGAHFDHIGVGPGGRVGCGANDNGSGVSAFLEVMEAMAEAPPRRSIIFANFSGEEDGLVGAYEIARRLPVEQEKLVCMINLDQIGFGEKGETSVLGVNRNPKLQKVLDRAKRLDSTGLRKVITGKGEDLWQRSDHYAFHDTLKVPVLFFFEGLPISNNKDYHTWRDTVEKVNVPKVTNTARMVYNTLWILANDDSRPPAPRD